jgi:hypothetical protein
MLFSEPWWTYIRENRGFSVNEGLKWRIKKKNVVSAVSSIPSVASTALVHAVTHVH